MDRAGSKWDMLATLFEAVGSIDDAPFLRVQKWLLAGREPLRFGEIPAQREWRNCRCFHEADSSFAEKQFEMDVVAARG